MTHAPGQTKTILKVTRQDQASIGDRIVQVEEGVMNRKGMMGVTMRGVEVNKNHGCNHNGRALEQVR